MAGPFDFGDPSNYYISPTNAGLLGAFQGIQPYLGPTRAPVSPWAVLAGALGGAGQGMQTANQQNVKNAYLAKETEGKDIANRTGTLGLLGVIDQFNARRALNGQEPVSTASILGGNFSLGGGGSSPQGILSGGAPAAVSAPVLNDLDPSIRSTFTSDPGFAATQPGVISSVGKPNAGTLNADASTMTRAQAAAYARQLRMAGYDAEAQKYTDYAMKGVEGGFENGPNGLTPIMGGPQDPRYKAQSAGAVTSATQAAELPFVGPRAAAQAAGTFFGAPQRLGPGDTFVQAGPGGSMQTVMQSPFPAPGTQEGTKAAGVGKTQSDAVAAWYTDAQTAAAQNQTIAPMIQQLDEGLKTGTGFDTRQWISNALATAGIDPSQFTALVDPRQAGVFTTGQKQLLIDRAKAFGANPSNAEDRRVEQSIASASSPTEATRTLLQWMQAKNDRAIAKFGTNYPLYKQGADPLELDLAWNKKYGASGAPSIVPPKQGAAAPAAGGGAPVTLNGKSYVKGPDGQWRVQ